MPPDYRSADSAQLYSGAVTVEPHHHVSQIERRWFTGGALRPAARHHRDGVVLWTMS